MGKLIVIEGLDGSGKTTQFDLIPQNLLKNGIETMPISFPNYNDDSSALVKLYLSGQFGSKPGDVNAYAASVFYAVDRYASFKRYWGEYYNSGGVVIASRYVTSNAAHQTAKLPKSQWENYLAWLYDLEYNKIGIPKPDKVIFLDMPVEVSAKLMLERYKGDESKKDIHERDTEYLNNCRKAAIFAADYSGWDIIQCAYDGQPLSIDDIADLVLKSAMDIL